MNTEPKARRVPVWAYMSPALKRAVTQWADEHGASVSEAVTMLAREAIDQHTGCLLCQSRKEHSK